MRKFLIFSTLFYPIFLLSQNSFFVKLNNEKVIMNDESVVFNNHKGYIQYLEDGKNWERYIKYSEMDYAVYNNKYLKSFELISLKGKKKSRKGYFVITENEEYLLISSVSTISRAFGERHVEFYEFEIYEIVIIDKQNNIKEAFEGDTRKEDTIKSNSIYLSVNKYFPNCQNLKILENYKDNIENIVSFFYNHDKINCN